ncbi:hypothetical protein [Desulfosporosinus sp. OT]|uniref:hypothetical protein n=1 Tax=Desulfosporosinus sp. OT TaxID=913865 RepID=UPI000223AD44|nr:hypothetical protein [Desulfosporosinus sp. OT]EGW40342.1 hypothetical protein DOT_1682 [Desulfosporosinus sp. OT]
MKLKIDLSKLKNLDLSLKSLKSLKLTKKMPNFVQKAKTKRFNSSSLSLSKRDFILLGLLVIGLEGYGLYNYLLSPKWQEYNSLQTRYAAEQVIAANFEKDMVQKNQYIENLNLLNYKLSGLKRQVPTEIPQEEIVLTLNKLAKARKLDINGMNLSAISAVSKQDFAAGKTSSVQSRDTGKVTTPTSVDSEIQNSSQGTMSTSTANDSKASKSKAKVVANMVLVEDVDVSFSGNYGALYNFISDLEQSERKIIVKEVSMTRGSGGLLKGELKVQYVGYTTPEDESTYSLAIPPINGKDSPFIAYPGFMEKVASATDSDAQTSVASTTAPVKTINPSFYLILNTVEDNAPKVILGDYTKNGTELYSNVNDRITGKISVSGDIDKMTYSYALGNSTQTKEGKLIIDGGKLRLDVISQQRTKVTDKAGITLDVDNKTNYPLEINVINDDKNNPRFRIGNKTGIVEMK